MKKGIDKWEGVWYINQAVASGRAWAAANEKSFEKYEKSTWQNEDSLVY